MTKHIMVDLETMGTGSFAPIISLGATLFDPNVYDKKVISSFEARISLKSNATFGLISEADTIDWWMENTRDDARRELNKQEKLDLVDVLHGFRQWVSDTEEGYDEVAVWGNGVTFDNGILSNAYGRCDMARPWSYKGDRCFRTMKNLVGPNFKPVQYGTPHRSLHDAISQAFTLKKIVKKLGLVIP